MLIVSDEIHFDLIMPGYHHTVFSTISEEFNQHCVVCTAPSKTFNLAGMQTSNIMIANEEIRKKFIDQVESCGMYIANILGYEACRIAYTDCDAWLKELLEVIVRNKEYIEQFVARHLPQVKVKRLEGTYLPWLDFRAYGLSAKELEHFMKMDAQLFFDDGYMFGQSSEGFKRINMACPTWVIEQAMDRLLAAMKEKFPETVQ